MDNPVWWLAATVLCLSWQLRAIRLYIALGKMRPTLRVTSFAQFSGIVCGFLSFAFAYECVVLLLCSLWKRKKIAMALYTLTVLRVFDILILLCFALLAAPVQEVRMFLLFLVLMLTVIWLSIYGIVPILMRVERYLLAFPQPLKGDRHILQWSYFFRKSILESTWQRRGTLPLIAALSAVSWFLEWLSLYLVLAESQSASLAIVERVGGSLGLAVAGTPLRAYEQLMPAIYIFTALLAIYVVVRNGRIRGGTWKLW